MSNFVINPYSFVSSEVQFCQSNGGALEGMGDDNAFFGNVITSGNSVIGASCTALTMYLDDYNDSSPGGTIYARVYNDSGVLQHTWNSINANTLTGSNVGYTFTGDSFTIQEDYRVGIVWEDKTGGGRVDSVGSSQSGWSYIERNGGSWTTPSTSKAFKMCITGIPA